MSIPRGTASLGASVAVLIFSSAIGQVLTILRTVYVAGRVGDSPQLDAALVALVVPNLIANVFVNSFAIALVPGYLTQVRTDPMSASRLGGQALTLAVVFGLVGTTLAIVTADAWVSATSPGFDATGHQLASSLVDFTAPLVASGSIAAVLGAICQANGKNRALGASWTLGSAAALALVVFGWDSLGPRAYALAPSAGFLGSSLVLLWICVRNGYIALSIAPLSHHGLFTVLRRSVPLAAGTLVGQFNEIIDRAVSSTLTVGAISTLRFAEQIATAPTRLLVPGFSAAILPALVANRTGDSPRTSPSAGPAQTVVAVVTLTIPIAAALAALAPLGVSVAYARGQFAESLIGPTALTVAALSPLVVIAMTSAAAASAHAAAGRTGLLAIAAVFAAVSNLALDLTLGPLFGVPGIGLATSIASGGAAALLVFTLRRHEPGPLWSGALPQAGRSLVASAAAALPVAVLAWDWGQAPASWLQIIRLIGLVGLGATIFAISAVILRIDSVLVLLRALRNGKPKPS
jgi:putative peptidoglycan lipid II flippase